MKKTLIFSLLLLVGFLFSTNSVLAEEDIFYTNNKGVTFTRNEYDFFTKMYYDGYQEYMSQADKDYFNDFNMTPESVERVEYDEDAIRHDITDPSYGTRATVHETGAKKLSISKTTSGYSAIVVSLKWKSNPNVRSYDVIGARLSGTSLIGTPSTSLTYSGGSYTSSNTVYPSGGFGTSIKLPSAGSSIRISQTYSVNNGGTVYASYQHAKSSVTLSQSQNYSISSAGYGSVFAFASSVSSKYDGMGGVYIGV